MRHLYVHIPFCARRCTYCDFSIAVRNRVPAEVFVDCIQRELRLLASARDVGWVDPGAVPRGSPELPGRAELQASTPPEQGLDTVYLGGGTPSLLPPDALAALLASLLDAFPGAPSEAVEITLEANPEDVTPDAASAWRRAGVNRVSLGAQSFDDRVLQWMHRAHKGTRTREAMQTLRETGFDNVSLDLIFALPAELDRDWSRDLDQALSLRPEHLSLYGLTVEERTPLARWIARGATSAPDDERYAGEYLLAHERLYDAGYRFYEVSNAALGDRRSRHNAAYWADRAYLGLGPAAHSYDGSARRWNIGAWEQYREAVTTGRSPIASTERLTADQRGLERVYLGLRTADGLAVTASDRLLPPLTAWVRAGWVVLRGDRVACTPEGWLRLDALVRDLTRLGD